MELTDEIKKILYGHGADLIGIGDMSAVENCKFKSGIAVAVALPKDIVTALQEVPTKEYYNLYYSLNRKLNEIVTAGEDFLKRLRWIGKNCLLITRQYGSAIRISSLLTNAPLKYNYPINPIAERAASA